MGKKFWLLMLAVVAFAISVGCGGGSGGGGGDTGGGGGDQGSGDAKPAMVTDVGGLGDQSFNDSANRGLERAKKELSVDTQVLESSAPADYQNNLTQLADNSFTPIYAIGFLMTDALKEIAPQYPDTNFAIVDSVVEADNVASLTFREQEGSYLAGVVAGLMTQEKTEYTNPDDKVVGFIGGQESDLIAKFEAGYKAGVKSVCSDCEVLSQYAGSTPDAFNDPARGKEIALQQINQERGRHLPRLRRDGRRASLRRLPSRTFLPSVWTPDQAKLNPDAPILTSVVKRVDNAVFKTIRGRQGTAISPADRLKSSAWRTRAY